MAAVNIKDVRFLHFIMLNSLRKIPLFIDKKNSYWIYCNFTFLETIQLLKHLSKSILIVEFTKSNENLYLRNTFLFAFFRMFSFLELWSLDITFILIDSTYSLNLIQKIRTYLFAESIDFYLSKIGNILKNVIFSIVI